MEAPKPEMEKEKPLNENQIGRLHAEKINPGYEDFSEKPELDDNFDNKQIKHYKMSKIYRGASYVIKEPAYLIKDVMGATKMPVLMGLGVLEALTFSSLTIAYGSSGWGVGAYSLYAVPFATYAFLAWLKERKRKNLQGGQWDDKKFTSPERNEQNLDSYADNYKKSWSRRRKFTS